MEIDTKTGHNVPKALAYFLPDFKEFCKPSGSLREFNPHGPISLSEAEWTPYKPRFRVAPYTESEGPWSHIKPVSLLSGRRVEVDGCLSLDDSKGDDRGSEVWHGSDSE